MCAAEPALGDANDGYLSCGFPRGLDEAWFRADYLLWQLDGSALPPLVTASPAGTPLAQAGRLDDPSTEVLAGGEDVGDRLRSGFELSGGYWFDPYNGFGVSGDYFNAGRDSYGFSGGPNSGQILARPFYNAQADDNDAELVDAPMELAGSVLLTTFDNFQGVGGAVEARLWDGGDQLSYERMSVTAVAGYRYYQHDSIVRILEDSTALAGNTMMLPAEARTVRADEFAACNRFHGAEFGLKGTLRRDVWWVDGLALVAFGGSKRTVFVEGATLSSVPGDSGFGGLLTSAETNIGRYVDSRGEVIPRFRVGAGARLTDWLSIQAGYNVIIWNNIVQAASHLPPDLAVDPRNLPPVQAGGGPEPAFPGMQSTDLVAHGLDVGLEIAY